MIFIVSFSSRKTIIDIQPAPQIISSLLIQAPAPHTAKPPAEKTLAAIKSSSQPSHPAITSTAAKSTPVSTLTALLHAAIQREQQYPASAQEQERQGRVTLVFTLYPDGKIANPRIAQTSGTQSLDHAALAALNAAAPFQHVDRYLKTPGDYQVDVVFTLS